MIYLNGISLPEYPQKIKPTGNRWVVPGWYAQAPGTFAVAANLIYYIPIFVTETTTYIRIGIEVTAAGAGGSTADLRIFNWLNGLPGSLVLSAGTVATDAIAEVEIVIAQTLTPGYYFLAFRCDSTPTVQTFQPLSAIAPPAAGLDTTINGLSTITMLVNAAYADPAPAPTATAPVQMGPMVWLREN